LWVERLDDPKCGGLARKPSAFAERTPVLPVERSAWSVSAAAILVAGGSRGGVHSESEAVVREEVELYEGSGWTEGTTRRDTGIG
jgi:hypothetical protein